MKSVKSDPMIPELFRIQEYRRERGSAFSITLSAVNSFEEFSFQPGQFNMLYVFGHGEVPISITGNPEEKQNIAHTVKIVGSVTYAMSALQRGDMLGVRGPFGSAWPLRAAKGKDVLLAAGGLGLAPFKPLLYHILMNRQEYGKVVLYYGAKTPQDILYSEELKQWSDLHQVEITLTVDTPDQEWQGNIGVVPRLIEQCEINPEQTISMICGPEMMIRFCINALLNKGMKASEIYLSMERNMKCAAGFCGRCQFGPYFLCREGPVFSYHQVKHIFNIREV